MSRIIEFDPTEPNILVNRVVSRVNRAIDQSMPHAPPYEDPEQFSENEGTLLTSEREITQEMEPLNSLSGQHGRPGHEPIKVQLVVILFVLALAVVMLGLAIQFMF